MFYRAVAATCPGNEKEYNSHNIYLNSKYITEEIKASEVLLRQKKEQEGLQFYAISEGFGAERFADEASLIAIKKLYAMQTEAMKEEMSDDYDEAADSLYSHLEDFIKEAEEAVVAKATELAPDNVYASIAAVSVYENAMIACNLGNTKIFLYRKGKLNILSEEHNQAYKMLKNGIIDEERYANHPKKNKLTQYLGILPGDNGPAPYYSEAEIKHGDIMVICSSTFCDKVSEEDICDIIKNSNSLTQITEKLMMAASEDGFEADTSVLVIRADSHEKAAVAGASVAGAAVTGAAAGMSMANKATVNATSNNKTGEIAQNAENSGEVAGEEAEGTAAADNSVNGNEKVPFSKKFRKFLGLTSDNENEKIWPALLTFGCCLLVVVLLGVLGWKIYDISKSDNSESNKGASISSESPVSTVEPTDVITTDEPTEEPTQEPDETDEPSTSAPTLKPTQAPATEAPATEAPATEAPATEAPATEAPATEAPATEAPATEAPATEAPETEAPATEAPATEAPATEAPATEAPATEAPATEAPATEAPVTEAPATQTPVLENTENSEE